LPWFDHLHLQIYQSVPKPIIVLILGLEEEEAFTLAEHGGFLASLAMAAGLTMTVLCCEGSFESG